MKIETNNDTYISNKLITWYQTNRRELPWRETTNPYIIWISEIILQQTRVAQGLDYFNRFVARFPNVQALAEALLGPVVAEQFGGKFPTDYSDVKSLKGIGDYTAAAIVSFAWNKPYAVVDGNVYRVLSRLFAIETPIDTTQGKKVFAELASSLLSHQQAGLHNQAIMELGALQCIPQNPDCTVCPLTDVCMAYLQQNGVLVAPSKAVNAGGVAVSGLEMSQNSERISWSAEEVDGKLKNIMSNIHKQIVKACDEFNLGYNLVAGANVAGFKKVAEAMIDQGIV